MSLPVVIMHKQATWRLLLVSTVLLMLSGCSVFGIHSEKEARYTILDQQGDFELREYQPLVLAQTSFEGQLDDDSGEAFRRLFAYISGENEGELSISMTAPVLAGERNETKGKSIAMTAPVIAGEKTLGWTFAFVLPESYTINNAPVPSDANVRLIEVRSKLVAAMRYSGWWDQEVFNGHSETLQSWIESKKLESVSLPKFAGYDPPWTLPFLRRNEILMDVR
jgi:hypothetical protein